MLHTNSHPIPRARADTLRVLPLLAGFVFIAAAFLVYRPALGGDLVWDDLYLVQKNPFFRSPSFGLEVFRNYLFFDSFSTYYRPIQNWSYILDYVAWRGNPLGYHCTNVILHGLTGYLLWLLLRELLPTLQGDPAGNRRQTEIAAALVALVWTVHPTHNAAVAYISGRADSLAAVFALAAWLCLHATIRTKQTALRLALGPLAGLSLLLALCSKEIALVWLALILAQLWFFDRTTGRNAKLMATFGALIVVGLYAFLHSLPGHRAPMENGPPDPWDARILLMLRALGDYTSVLLYPARLYMERSISDLAMYRNPTAWRDHIRYEYLSVIGLLAIVAAIWSCSRRETGRGWRIFGSVWFVIAFLPISNLFPLNAEVAEHWIYLASIGFLIFVAGVAVALPMRWHRAAAFAGAAAVLALGARTAIRSSDWIDGITFCARTIADGGETPRILSTLASIYAQRGDLKRQEAVLRHTMKQFPDYTPARMNLGICLSRQGRKDEAAALLGETHAQADEMARQYPSTWTGALQLAQLRQQAGHTDEARAIVAEARRRFPEIWELAKAECELARESAGAPAAAVIAQDFASRHWWHYDAQSTLGALRYAAGQPDAAIGAFRDASRLDVYDGRALAAVAEIERDRGRFDAALSAQAEAMERDPGQPKHYAELALILGKMGRQDEAAAALRRAQTLASEALHETENTGAN